MDNNQNLDQLKRTMNTLQSLLTSCSPLEELKPIIEDYRNAYELLNQRVEAYILSGLKYSKKDYEICLELFTDIKELFEKRIKITNMGDLMLKTQQKTKTIPFDTLIQFGKLTKTYKQFCEMVEDSFLKLYHDTEILVNKYNGIQYYNENVKHYKKKGVNDLDKEAAFKSLELSLASYKTLGSLVSSNRTEPLFIKNDIIRHTCASDFATHVLNCFEEQQGEDINYTEVIDSYFFTNGASSKVYTLVQKLLHDHDKNSYFNNLYLHKNNAFGYTFIRQLNISANSIIFGDSTAQEKIKAYLLLCGCIKNYNKCISGLLDKCTYENYMLTDEQKSIIRKYISNKESFSFRDLITLLKDKYKEESLYRHIEDFVKTKKEHYLIKGVNAQVEKELYLD